MTRDEAKKLLPVIQAFADGKDVQFKMNGNWFDCGSPNWVKGYEYRIKPEPLECWLVKHPDGIDFYTCSIMANSAFNRRRSPRTIHHMREVLP